MFACMIEYPRAWHTAAAPGDRRAVVTTRPAAFSSRTSDQSAFTTTFSTSFRVRLH